MHHEWYPAGPDTDDVICANCALVVPPSKWNELCDAPCPAEPPAPAGACYFDREAGLWVSPFDRRHFDWYCKKHGVLPTRSVMEVYAEKYLPVAARQFFLSLHGASAFADKHSA